MDSTNTLNKKALLWLLCVAILFICPQFFQSKLLFDGLVYWSVSKNMANTNDFFHFSYSPEQFKEFYQHPPLMFWLQAFVIKIFGPWVSESSFESLARLLPATMAVGTVLLTYSIGSILSGTTAGLISAFVLLTSTRFLKWGTNFYLDGPITFFLVLSFYFWVRAFKLGSPLNAAFSGFAALCAFMTKGIIAFAIFPIAGLFLLESPKQIFRANTWKNVGAFLVCAAFCFGVWWFGFNGKHFLEMYFSTSAGRVQFENFYINPWMNLYNRWLPWGPILALSLFFPLAKFKMNKAAWALTLGALVFPVAFSFGIVYFEHYMTPFYPFAALALGLALGDYSKLQVTERFFKPAWIVALVISMLLATFTPPLHEQKKNAPDLWLAELATMPVRQVQALDQIAFTEKSTDLWVGLAYIQGRSRFKAIGSYALDRQALPKTLLITQVDEVPHSSWKPIPCFYVEGFRAYANDGDTWCKNP